MTEQEENELIADKLLGWKRTADGPAYDLIWLRPEILRTKEVLIFERTPTFTNWQSAGLILDALEKAGVEWDIHTSKAGGFLARVVLWRRGNKSETDWDKSAPLAIRAAALSYIKEQE